MSKLRRTHRIMNTQCIPHGRAERGFISAQAAIVLAVIAGGAGLLVHEWHSADATKTHHSSSGGHHHEKHGADTAATR